MASLKVQAHKEFASWSKSYDRSILQHLLFDPSHKKIAEQVAAAGLPSGNGAACLLDIGCGTAKLAHRLTCSHTDLRVFGIDLSESMLRAAPTHISDAPRIHLTVADSEHLPFPDQTFDFVTCANSFHHYPNQLAALREMRRVLKIGGRLLLEDGYRDHWYGWFIFDYAVTRAEGGHVHHCSAQEFRERFAAAGFDDIQQHIVHFPAPFILTVRRAKKD